MRLLYIALVNGWQNTEMPIDIYDAERFSPHARGRIKRDRKDLGLMRNQHFGLLKGYMPIAADDIARSSTPFEHIKSCDYASFNLDSAVVQACFQQFVHPFSNSISGSFLVFLRLLARLHDQQLSNDFTSSIDKLMLLLRLSMSSALYYSGGHSLYEYMAILKMPEVEEFFQYLPGFAELDLGQIFFESNEAAFNAALKETIDYNDKLMDKKTLHAELLSFF